MGEVERLDARDAQEQADPGETPEPERRHVFRVFKLDADQPDDEGITVWVELERVVCDSYFGASDAVERTAESVGAGRYLAFGVGDACTTPFEYLVTEAPRTYSVERLEQAEPVEVPVDRSDFLPIRHESDDKPF